MAETPELVTLSETAALLRIKPATIRSWRLYGKKNLRFTKVSGRVFVTRTDLNDFIAKSAEASSAEVSR